MTNNSLGVFPLESVASPGFVILDRDLNRDMFMSLINAFLILHESAGYSYFFNVP